MDSFLFSSACDSNFLDYCNWDYNPDCPSQHLFEMLDEDIAYINESNNTLIKDIMWNSSSQSDFGLLESSCLVNDSSNKFTSVNSSTAVSSDSIRAIQSTMSYAEQSNHINNDSEFYDRIFSKKLDEEYPANADDYCPDFDLDLPSPLSDDQLYDSCVSSPLSMNSCEQDQPIFLDDAGFSSDLDLDFIISALKPSNSSCSVAQSAQYLNQMPTFDFPSAPNKLQTRFGTGSSFQGRRNVRKISGRIGVSSRGESLIMRTPTTGQIQKTKSKPGPKTTSVSVLGSRAAGTLQAPTSTPMERKTSHPQIKLSPKSRQATRNSSSMLKSSSASSSLSLLSSQDAMLKGASSLISPPISSDSDESVSSAEDSREKSMLKKKRLSTGPGNPCLTRNAGQNILTSIQPGVFSSVSTVNVLSGHPSPSPAQPNQQANRPLKRREHNDSERKRRDHLRSAFDELKLKVPKLANSERKPARIMILAEAANYAREITETDERNQQAMKEALAEQQRLQQLLDHYAANGLV